MASTMPTNSTSAPFASSSISMRSAIDAPVPSSWNLTSTKSPAPGSPSNRVWSVTVKTFPSIVHAASLTAVTTPFNSWSSPASTMPDAGRTSAALSVPEVVGTSEAVMSDPCRRSRTECILPETERPENRV